MVARRHLGALRPEQALEPAVAERDERGRQRVARVLSTADSSRSEIPFSSSLRSTGVGDPGELRLELLARAQQLEPVGVERGARLGLDLAELLAVGVVGQHRQLRLRGAQRHLLAA